MNKSYTPAYSRLVYTTSTKEKPRYYAPTSNPLTPYQQSLVDEYRRTRSLNSFLKTL